ncbi:hypothetical protein [Maliponia aquimaris]|uniref:hypothetical protein n=1 Tax=Maliponia aquimaris TaxID=1673631 RepID=UPI0015956D4D|nr:hypothetical protein [Maliponia aquimaris]
MRQELPPVFSPDFAETHEVYTLFLWRYCLHESRDTDSLDMSYLRQVLGQLSF